MAIAAASRGLPRALSRYLRRLSSSSTESQNAVPSASAAKKKLRKERNLEKSISLLSSISNLTSSAGTSRHSLEVVIKRLARARRFSDVETILESRKKSAAADKEPHFAYIITCYGHAGMIDHAERLFDEMEALGSPRTALSFNALLTAFNHTDNPGRVSKLFTELSKKHDIVPDKVSYGILVKSLCQSRSAEKVYPVLKEMEEKGIEITPVTYTTLLDTLYKGEKVSEAEKLWKEMECKGCSLDVAAYNVKIMYYAHHGKPQQVIKLIENMESAGIKPDTISYNYLITCYCKNGRCEDAKKVYKSLREKGCNPNAATYRNFMYFLCKNGDFEGAMEVCMEGIKKDKVPDFGPMKMLVEGLVKKYKLEEAKSIVKKVKEHFPESFISRWRKVVEKLGLDDGEEDFSQAGAA